MDLSGTVVPMATPIERGTGDINKTKLVQFTNRLIEGGVHGLFPGSSIGEFSSLTPRQNRTLIETVAEVAKSVPVFAGCGGTSVSSVVENIEAAADADADIAVVVTPYYLSTTQPGLKRFFTSVADRSSLPIVLYNIPPLTGNTIEIQTIKSLAEHEEIVGLKDTSGDLTYHHQVNERTPDDFILFQGATELAAASLELGSDGLIAGPANVFPEQFARLYDAYESNEHEIVSQLMNQVVAPMVSATSNMPTAAAIKHLVAVHSMDIGAPLAPLPALTESECERLEETYRRVLDGIERRTD